MHPAMSISGLSRHLNSKASKTWTGFEKSINPIILNASADPMIPAGQLMRILVSSNHSD